MLNSIIGFGQPCYPPFGGWERFHFLSILACRSHGSAICLEPMKVSRARIGAGSICRADGCDGADEFPDMRDSRFLPMRVGDGLERKFQATLESIPVIAAAGARRRHGLV